MGKWTGGIIGLAGLDSLRPATRRLHAMQRPSTLTERLTGVNDCNVDFKKTGRPYGLRVIIYANEKAATIDGCTLYLSTFRAAKDLRMAV
jgi:hypothetical protein